LPSEFTSIRGFRVIFDRLDEEQLTVLAVVLVHVDEIVDNDCEA
jgi:hypothetical protein